MARLTFRRREKFVLASILLSVGLTVVQHIPLDWRFTALIAFSLFAYLVSAISLADDLQWYEWFTILPLPALYAGAVGWFYFLLPENLLSQIVILGLFGIGMYAIYLMSNIFSVAKGRTVQLLYAARATSLVVTLLVSFLFTSTIFSLGLPIYTILPVLAGVHFLLIFMAAWSVRLKHKQFKIELILTSLLTWLVIELNLALSFFPFQPWQFALFTMTFLYIGLSIVHSYLQDRLFFNVLKEYILVAVFGLIIFILFFPGK